MDRSKLNEQIADFWEWFGLNIEILKAVITTDHHPKTEGIIQGLDQHILGMGKLKWELGNPFDGQFTFTISPNNDRELLAITKAIIAQSPNDPNWKFLHAIEASNNYEIQVYDIDMDIQNVDAKPWRVILIPGADNRFEMVLEIANIEHLDEDTQLIAADLILTSLLGEENKVNYLAGLELTNEFEEEDAENCFPIQQLLFQLIG